MLIGVPDILLRICAGRISALFFTMKGQIFRKRIGGLLMTIESFDRSFEFSCDGSFWQKLCAIGLGGVWNGPYFSFPSHQALIHFCFLNGFFDFLDSHLYEFKYQMARARARMRAPFSLGDSKPIELSDIELSDEEYGDEEYDDDTIPF
jgi:hypothetical protein